MLQQNTGTGDDALDLVLERLGYAYDANQEIIYSTREAWQRKFGYCRLYDEAAALLNMIIDCEPIRFAYRGKRWLIQFWKGQYALTTGGEIGVYKTGRADIDIPGVFNGPFYNVVGDDDLLPLSFTLYRNGKALFSREDKHWWLTGFVLGEFSEPEELSMHLTVALQDEMMLHAFVKGLKKAGYGYGEITVNGTQVSLLFAEPRTPQPVTRTPATDWLIQRKNEMLCRMYRQIAGQAGNLPDKLEELRKQAPRLYNQAMQIGKTAQFFKSYDLIRRHLT